MTGSTNPSSNLTRAVTPQFSFNKSDGTITLSNGKKFAVEIGGDNGFKKIGRDNEKLIGLVTKMLDEIGEQETIKYKDLSQTKITNEGVTTDQKEKPAKTYKLATHEQQYKEITQTAQRALSELPKTPVASNRLSVDPSSERGRDVSDLNESTSPSPADSTSLQKSHDVSNDKVAQSSDDSSDDSQVDSDPSSSILELQVERISKEPPTVATSVNEAATVRFTLQKKPGVVNQIKQKILKWLSGFNFLTAHSETLQKVKETDPRAEVINANTPTEADKVDKETSKKFTNFTLESLDPTGSKKSEFNPKTLSLDTLEQISSETANIDGKVKVRKQDGKYVIRAGHRVGKPGSKKKRTGKKSGSIEAMKLMLKASLHNKTELNSEHKQLTKMKSFLDNIESLPESETELQADSWIEQAESLTNIFDSAGALPKLISALKAFKKSQELNDGSTADQLDAVKAEKNNLLDELKEVKNPLTKQVADDLDKVKNEMERVDSVVTLLTLHSNWGKAITENHSEVFGSIISDIQSQEPEKATWEKRSEFIDRIFNPDKQEFRSNFEKHYRWIMSSSDYINLLNERYQESKPEEQKVILKMIANWVSREKVDPTEINQIVSDDQTIKDVITDIRDRIADNSDYKLIRERIDSALTESAPIDDTAPKDPESDFQQDLVMIATGQAEKSQRNETLNAFMQDLTTIVVNKYKKIQPSEFTDCAWAKAKSNDQTSPNLLNAIEQFNTLSSYFQLLIMTVKEESGDRRVATVEEQAKMIEFLIDAQTKAVEQGDLGIVMAIQSAFTSSSISRLKVAWKKVPDKKITKFNTNAEHTSYDSAAKNQREFAKDHPNGVPFIGIYLTDLTFSTEDKKVVKNEGDTQMINTFLVNQASKLVDNALRAQSLRVTKRPERSLEAEIKNVNKKAMGDNDLYALSLQAQPRATA